MADSKEITLGYERIAWDGGVALAFSNLCTPQEMKLVAKNVHDDINFIYRLTINGETLGHCIYKVDKLPNRKDLVIMYQMGLKAGFVKYNKILSCALAKYYGCTHLRAHVSAGRKDIEKLAEQAGFEEMEKVYSFKVQ